LNVSKTYSPGFTDEAQASVRLKYMSCCNMSVFCQDVSVMVFFFFFLKHVSKNWLNVLNELGLILAYSKPCRCEPKALWTHCACFVQGNKKH